MLPLRPALLVLAALAALAPGTAAAQYFAFGKNRIQYEAPDWRILESEHFDTYFYGPEGDVLAEVAARAAEQALVEAEDLLGVTLERRVPLLVFPSHSAFAVTNAIELPVYAEGIGGVTERGRNRVAVPFTGDWRTFRQVVRHETVHALLNDALYGRGLPGAIGSDGGLRLPLWLGEGLAEYVASGWSATADLYVREAALRGALPAIPRIRGYLAYPAGQSVWDFLVEEYGRETVAEIVRGMQASRSVGAAFQNATGLGPGALSERWQGTLRAVYYPEGAREDLGRIGRPVGEARGGQAYTASPAISPQGDRVAYVAARGGLFDVFVAPTSGGEPVRVASAQDNPTFESLRLFSPGLAWSPDGRFVALAAKSGPGDIVALIDVETRVVRTVRPQGLSAIYGLAWHPAGRFLALEATAGAASDLWLLDLETEALVNLTRDVYSDHAPAWSPDGRRLVFYSDRDAQTALGRAPRAGEALALAGYGTRIYALDLVPEAAPGSEAAPDSAALSSGTGPAASTPGLAALAAGGALPRSVTPLTEPGPWDATAPAVTAAGDLLFVSNRNGIPNLYVREGAGVRPLTDLQEGLLGFSWAVEAERGVALALRAGTPALFVLQSPQARTLSEPDLAPSVWAARRLGDALEGTPPALALALPEVVQANPLLRDAADGRPFGALPLPPDSAGVDRDTSSIGPIEIDLGNDPELEPGPEDALPFVAEIPLAERRYRLDFSPDLVYASGQFETLFGVQALVGMEFADVLGGHRVGLSTNLLIDLRNADYALSYAYLERRADVIGQVFHLARVLPGTADDALFRYRNYGASLQVRFPVDKFRRVDFQAALLGVSLLDLATPTERAETRTFVYPTITYTLDYTEPGAYGPQAGQRLAVRVGGSPFGGARFVSVLADVRQYARLGGDATLALRASAGASEGRDPQTYYAAGVENWVNASFQSLPVEGPGDFVFATPVLPLRGFGFNEASGTRFGLVNAEARVPLLSAVTAGPVSVLSLYDLQAVAFVDAGVVFADSLTVYRPELGETGERLFDDVLIGAGVGLRSVLLGTPIRLDYAWPFTGESFGDGRLYFSVGVDF